MNEDEGTLPDSKKRKSATARFVDDKRKKLEKQLSGKQKDGLMLQVMREDVELKKKLLVQSEQPSKADDALMKIADSMHTLSQAILTGFQHLQAQSLFNTSQLQEELKNKLLSKISFLQGTMVIK